MFVPAVGVLAAYVVSGASLDIEWKCLPWRWAPAALLLLPLAIHSVALPGVFLLEENYRGCRTSRLARATSPLML